MRSHKILNTPAVRRMPTYFHKLMLMKENGEKYVSTSKLAEYMNSDPIIVRKDLELTGAHGFPGVGFHTEELIESIRRYVGWDSIKNACLAGAGSLGSALLGHVEFREYGLFISGVFDNDPGKIGTMIHERQVQDSAELEGWCRKHKPDLAVICVSGNAAQAITDRFIKCGVRAFWNFANVSLSVPTDILVQREVIAGGFALLSMKMKQHLAAES